jgi:hypothetical protein
MKKPRKPKPTEPSLRDKLSHEFLRAFESDFEAFGVEAIKALREKSPEKYSEIAARLIATTEPKSDSIDFNSANSLQEIALKLLQSVGVNEFEATDNMIQAAIEANDNFIARLMAIRDEAQGAMQ